MSFDPDWNVRDSRLLIVPLGALGGWRQGPAQLEEFCLSRLRRAGKMPSSPVFMKEPLGPLSGRKPMTTLDMHKLEPLLARAQANDGQAFAELLVCLRPYFHKKVRQELRADGADRIDRS